MESNRQAHDGEFSSITWRVVSIIFGYLNSISNVSLIFSETIIISQKKLHVPKSVYLDEIYKLYLEYVAKFCILVEKKTTVMIFMVFLWFHHENQLLGNFHYYICIQRVKIRKYGKFYGNEKVHLFETFFFFRKSHFSR